MNTNYIDTDKLKEKGFSLECVGSYQNYNDISFIFELSHDDYPSIYYNYWFGDKDDRFIDSVNEFLTGSMYIDLCEEIYVELENFTYSEIYDVMFNDYSSELSDQSRQLAIDILKKVIQ